MIISACHNAVNHRSPLPTPLLQLGFDDPKGDSSDRSPAIVKAKVAELDAVDVNVRVTEIDVGHALVGSLTNVFGVVADTLQNGELANRQHCQSMQTHTDGDIVGDVPRFAFVLGVAVLHPQIVKRFVVVGSAGDDIAMQEETRLHAQVVTMPIETGGCVGVLLQSFYECGFAIMVSKYKMKLTVSIFRMKLVDPLDGPLERMQQGFVCAPFEIEYVATEHQRVGPPHLLSQLGHQIIGTRPAGKQVQVRDKKSFPIFRNTHGGAVFRVDRSKRFATVDGASGYLRKRSDPRRPDSQFSLGL
jgi:hypothetical protein